MLIVSKPKKIEEELEAQEKAKIANALDVDFLKFDELDIDLLEEEVDEEVAELDFDFLLQDFLQDILEVINIQLAAELGDKQDTKKIKGEEIGSQQLVYNLQLNHIYYYKRRCQTILK